MKRDHWLYLLAVVGGALVWALVATISGKREAWDSEWYFTLGIPAVCLLAAVLGYLEPIRPWRWGLAPNVGQLACMLVMQGVGSMLPMGVILLAIMSIPAMITAWMGAAIGREWRVGGSRDRGQRESIE